MQSNDPSQAVRVEVDEVFTIALPSNPTTGYTWHASVEPGHLELLSQEFEPSAAAVGAGGREVFRVHALAVGETEIALEYRRPWDVEARDTARFRVFVGKAG